MDGCILKNSRSRYSPVKTAKKTHQKELILSGYKLTQIPDELFCDPFDVCLVSLDLSNNEIENLGSSISALQNLEVLILSSNKLTAVPKEIESLKSLIKLDLSRNCLTSVCREINSLKNLEEINLSGNNLTEIPRYLLSLPKLRKVFCIRNANLRNIPRDIAADGLEAMRKYLNIKVEEYEIFEEEKKKDIKSNQRFNKFLEEIEKSWTLKEDQYVRKTKDACIGPDQKENGCSGLNDSFDCSLIDRCCSTQTDYRDLNSSFDLASAVNPLLRNNRNENFGMRPISHQELDGNSNGDRSIEKLVKIFHNQLNMVNEHKMQFLLDTEQKSSAKCDMDSLSLSLQEEQYKKVVHCRGCGLRKKEFSTSEYGTMSTCSRKYSLEDCLVNDDDSCDGNEGSVHDDLQSDGELEDNDSFDSSDSLVFNETTFWSSSPQHYLNACKELVLTQSGIQLTIPELNLSGHQQSDFSLEIVDETIESPVTDSKSVLATPILCALPHGAKFYTSSPAYIKLPLTVVLDNDCQVKCYESDTSIDEDSRWNEIESFEVNGNFVTIKTTHFSLFCATVSKNYSQTEKSVTVEDGASLVLDDLPGLKVEFPCKSVDHDITATLTTVYDDEYQPRNDKKVIASPVIAMGPSGMNFKEDVLVTLPLPDASKVFKVVENPQLSIMQSQTDLKQKPVWKKMHVRYEIRNVDGIFTVTFRVKHFTLFTSLWNIIGSTMENIKLQAYSFIPNFTHLVYFQALMSECYHTKRFGLCVICHRAGNPPVLDCGQYPIQVGKTLPRQLKTGEIVLKLKSSLFTADESVGEKEDGLTKSEKFIGRDFDKQFSLRFHDAFVGGPFGKICVGRKDEKGEVIEVLDFNLEKSNKAMNAKQTKLPTQWETKSIKEIAGYLSIEDRWKELCLALAYTREEINTKFANIRDPIDAVLKDFMGRGGEPEIFHNAMYKVARMYKCLSNDQMIENRENRRIENHVRATNNKLCNCPPTPEKTPQRSIKRKLNLTVEPEEPMTDAQLDIIAGEIPRKWKRVGIKLGIDAKRIQEIDQDNRNENEREKAFQMLLMWREKYPSNCCTSNLDMALRSCELNYTAQQFLAR